MVPGAICQDWISAPPHKLYDLEQGPEALQPSAMPSAKNRNNHLIYLLVVGRDFNVWHFHTAVPLSPRFCLLLFVTCDRQWSENIQWKISETNNSYIWNCKLSWAAWWNLTLSRSALPGMWIIPLSSVCIPHPAISHLEVGWVIRLTFAILQCLCSSHPYFSYIIIIVLFALLVLVVNLSLFLIYKLKFIKGMCV